MKDEPKRLPRTIARGPKDPSLKEEAEARYLQYMRDQRRERAELMARLDGRLPPMRQSTASKEEVEQMMQRLDGRADPSWTFEPD